MKSIFILILICLMVIIATETANRSPATESLSEFEDKIDEAKMQVKREETTLENPESNDKLQGASSFIKLSTPLIVLIAVLVFLTIPFNT